jgi:uncharacterized protein YcbK (DUF882 family)
MTSQDRRPHMVRPPSGSAFPQTATEKKEVIMSQRFIAVAIGVALAVSATSAQAKHRAKHHGKAAYSHHHKRNSAGRTLAGRVGRGTHGATVERGCLVPAARALLARIESNFGPVQLVSTCRPGAVIAGTHHPSLHRYGMAIDFKTPHKAAVLRWLIANNSGGTMTYSDMDHIHADVGRHFVSLAGQRRVARANRRAYPTMAAQAPSEGGGADTTAAGDWPTAQPATDSYRGQRYARHVRHHGRHEGTF